MRPQKKIRKGDSAFYVVAAFLCGVFIAGEHWNSRVVFIVMLIAGAIMFLLFQKPIIGAYALIIFFAYLLGITYYSAYIHYATASIHLPPGKNAAFFGLVMDEPKQAGNFIMLPLKLSRPYSGTIDIFASPIAQFHYGDMLWARGTIDASKNIDEDPVIFLPQLSLVTSNNGFWLKAWSINAKIFIAQKFAQLFSSDKAMLLTGIVLGNMNGISVTLKTEMDASGTSYIVGMYGYKIAIISLVMAFLLKDFLPKKWLLFLTIVIAWLFVFISGGSVSAIRAGVMGCLALLAAGLGRIFFARNALTFTALAMILINPRVLVDATFQLSFLSFLGIYYLGQPIKNAFHWKDCGWLQWKEHAMLSLATNLAILPVVINVFGGFSLLSLVSNVLIMIPWVLILFFGIMSIVLASIFLPLAFVAIQIENILLSYELFIIHIFSNIVIPIPSVFTSNAAIVFYYGMLLLVIYYYGEVA